MQLLTYDLVDGIGLDSRTVLALDKSHGNHTRAESGYIGFLAIILECLLDILFVIGLVEDDGHQTIDLVRGFK